MKLIVKNGVIHDAVHPQPYEADLLLEDGKIAAIGKGFSGDEVLDAQGLQVYPGFVDAHTHIGLDGFGMGYEGMDYNEMNDICSPQLRAIDGINPMDETFALARAGGVTCVCTGPGSANVLGGTFAVLKTVGRRVEDMVVIPEAAMKCAFGENPKWVYEKKCDSTRMSTAAILREALMKARRYSQQVDAAQGDLSKLPGFDMKLEALLPVVRGQMPLKAHAHQANDIFTAIRIAREFGLQLTLEHVTEGHLIVEELVEANLPLAVGPTMTHASKIELRHKSWTTPGILAKAGCRVSIITDSSVIQQENLPLCAGMAVRAGMDPFQALQAITLRPAQHIGAADRVGSIEVGKDADLVLTDGSPFAIATTVRRVLIDGKTVFQA